MDKTKLISDNLKKLDDALSGAGHWEYGDLVKLLEVRSQFVIDACSMIDRVAAQAGQCSQCGDKEAMAEVIYQRTLSVAIEKARKKAEIRHELPAAIDVVGCGQEVYKPCPHGVMAEVGSGYCTHYCSHRAEAEQWGEKVYCWYPEYRR